MRVWRIALIWLSVWSSTLPLPAAAQSRPPYLLSPTALAELGKIEPTEPFRGSEEMRARMRSGTPLGQVLARIADKRRGRYSGNDWSALETLYRYLAAPPHVALSGERFLIAHGCRPRSCDEKAAIVVDLRSGHVAFALLHGFTADRRSLENDSALTQFMMSCANPELRAFAGEHFLTWAKAEMAGQTNPPGKLAEAESKVWTTRC